MFLMHILRKIIFEIYFIWSYQHKLPVLSQLDLFSFALLGYSKKTEPTPKQFKLSLFHLIPTSLEVQSPEIESAAWSWDV